MNPARATFRGVPLTDEQLHAITGNPPATALDPVAGEAAVPVIGGLRHTGKRTRGGVPIYEPVPGEAAQPVPVDQHVVIRLGPAPGFWWLVALTVAAFPLTLLAGDRFGPAGALVVDLVYLVAALVLADITGPKPASHNGRRPRRGTH